MAAGSSCVDDTDRERSTEAFAQGIRDDLAWLGLTWEREERQSARTDRYAAAAAQLAAAGRLYPCLETGEELDRKRKRQLARGLPPFYDRASLKLAPDDRARLEAEGRRPHWRFRLANPSRAASHRSRRSSPGTTSSAASRPSMSARFRIPS